MIPPDHIDPDDLPLGNWDEWIEEGSEEAAWKRKKRRNFSVLFEDDDVIVFDKPAGLSVIPERDPTADSLKVLGEEKHGRLLTVHRIDRDTSGVVLFARSESVHRDLNQQFRDRLVEKEYQAVLEGELPEDSMDVDIPLTAAGGSGPRMKPSASGKPSQTLLSVLERFDGFTWVAARPVTGRQHQIRVHCQAVGFPLLVDPIYGRCGEFFLSSIKRNYRDYGSPERPLVDRQTLHAWKLSVDLPSGERRTFEAELPKDLRALQTQLRKLRSL